MTDAETTRPGESPARSAHTSFIVWLSLGFVVLVALGLHLWGIGTDLPHQAFVDEPIYLDAAVRMLRLHTLNPDWFGNPGSTLIYPLAALIELWYLVARHVPPFAHAMPSVGRAYLDDPTPFYLIGRGISVAFGVGSVVAAWLVGRRIVGDAGAVLAALLLPATAIVVAHGQIVRTDTAGMFFALIALWLILRAMEIGRARDWVLAAVAIGLGISTRYFLVTLAVPYAIAAVLWVRSTRGSGPTWRVPVAALAAAPVAFLVTTPFFLLDLPRVIENLRVEARTVHAGADGLSPIGNFAWYVGTVIPATFGPVLLVLAVIGIVIAARRRGPATAVLLASAVSYLVAVSASPLHFERYVIPLTPFVGIFATAALLAAGEAAVRVGSRWLGRDPDPDGRTRPLAVGVAGSIMLVLLLPSFGAVAAHDRLLANPSTRVIAAEWIGANLPPTSRIVQEAYAAYLEGTDRDVVEVNSLAERTMDAYRADGVDYLVTSTAIADRFVDPVRYPVQSAFYRALEETGRLIATFGPDADHAGPRISIYDVGTP